MTVAETSQVPIEALQSICLRDRLHAHAQILRLDHSVKQIFILPGIVIALTLGGASINTLFLWHVFLGLLSITLIASSNYVLNEMLDAPYDRLHPIKRLRPAACGRIYFPAGYLQWITLAFCGFGVAAAVSKGVFYSALVLWIMGCIYNIPPVRSKDTPYLDVLSESINNPLRFCAGWYMVSATVFPPTSLLISYWMLGAYFMSLKRFSEYRQNGAELAGAYRRSFRFYSEKSLLNSVVFYAASAMLFFGAFIMRYRLELILAFPLVALLMAVYFNLSFEEESAVQNPEKLYRQPFLMGLLVSCIVLLIVLLSVRLPGLEQWFPKATLH